MSLKWMLPAVAVIGLVFVLGATTAKAADGVITGKVVDKDGAAVADAKVNLTKPRDPGAARGTRQEPLATATTDKDGKFELKFDTAKVADGDYNVSCRVQDKGMATAKVTIKGGKADPADVSLKLAARTRRGGGGGAGGN